MFFENCYTSIFIVSDLKLSSWSFKSLREGIQLRNFDKYIPRDEKAETFNGLFLSHWNIEDSKAELTDHKREFPNKLEFIKAVEK